MRTRLELLASAIILIALTTIAIAWRAQQQATASLRGEIQSAQASLKQITTREKARDTQAQQTVATLHHQKSATQTPTQILQALPAVLPLPTPLSATLIKAPVPSGREVADNKNSPGGISKTSSPANTTPATTKNSAPDDSLPIKIPPEDLKPLYDFAVDCKACAVRLAAAQADLKDEQSKSATITKERDAALKAAKGGSVLRRVARATKWFVMGAAAGAVAAKLAH
jgi:hypothetical protein